MIKSFSNKTKSWEARLPPQDLVSSQLSGVVLFYLFLPSLQVFSYILHINTKVQFDRFIIQYLLILST